MKLKITGVPILFFLLSTYIMNVCQKQGNDLPVEIPKVVPGKKLLNVAYGNHPLQTMDIYLPENRTPDSTKFIVMIHGGGWNSGDKSSLTPYIDNLSKRLPGYAFFNINYRLAVDMETVFPVQENDVRAAMEFIEGRSSEYLVSTKYVLLGLSAGAHLALLQGYKNKDAVKPKGIISFFGPTDLSEMYNHPANPYVATGLRYLTGKTPQQDSLLYANYSPINFIDSNSPPTLIFHGGLDPLVKSTQSYSLIKKLQSAGVENKMVFYPNEGHGWSGATLNDSFNKIVDFLNTAVR